MHSRNNEMVRWRLKKKCSLRENIEIANKDIAHLLILICGTIYLYPKKSFRVKSLGYLMGVGQSAKAILFSYALGNKGLQDFSFTIPLAQKMGSVLFGTVL